MTAELRAAILAEPTKQGPRTVYADWLIEQADPRGEWIALHREDTDEAELKRRALWQLHGAKWRAEDVGTDAADAVRSAIYRKGFLEHVALEAGKLVELAPALAKQPVRILDISNLGDLDAIAALPVLATVESLELGYGLEKSSPGALVRLLEAVPRLRRLALSPQEDVPMVWEALERFPRLAELVGFELRTIKLTKDRAAWLGRALPAVKELTLDRALADPSLEALVEHAAFELEDLALSDHDGEHGRVRLMSDRVLAAMLQSPFVRGLRTLSLFGCNGRRETSTALSSLSCAATLTRLDVGSQRSSAIVEGLIDCKLPALTDLSIRHNYVNDGELDAILHFTDLTKLRVEKNIIGPKGVRKILEHLPNLETLDICDNGIGNNGALAIVWSENVTKLRSLNLSSTSITGDTVDGLIDSGKLTELRRLDLSCNEQLKKPAVKRLAEGPFDKLAFLSLSYGAKLDTAPLFADGWLPADEGGEAAYQRKLELDGSAVPFKPSKAKKAKKVVDEGDVPPIDETTVFKKGQQVKHDEYGVGTVTGMTTLSLDVKFPKVGGMRFARTPADAIPFDMKKTFAPDEVILHSQYGAGIVLSATKDRIEVEFGVAGKKTFVHGRA